MRINAASSPAPIRKQVSLILTGALLTTGIALTGCNSKTIVDQQRVAPTHISSGDAIVILGRRTSADHETEYDFINCVGKNLAGNGTFTVIPEKTFVDSMYPYFESSTAPTDVKNLEKLVQVPAIAQKFNDFRVRYFVWIDGYTETTDKEGSISCAIGPGGGGCFGFAMWDDAANYEASIWDFKELDMTGKINAETKGTSYLPAIIIPIPLLARVQSHACSAMSDQIKTFLQ